MRPSLTVLGALTLALPLWGCDQRILPSRWKNYTDCLKEHRSEDALSADAIATVCRFAYETTLILTDDMTTGHASLDDCFPQVDFNVEGNPALPRECGSFSGNLENRTKFTVLTAIELTVGNSSTGKSTSKWVEGLWIEPRKDGNFHMEFDPAFHAKNWNAVLSGYTWTVTGARGLRVD